METKRLFLAIGLTIIITFAWQWFSMQMGWIVPQTAEAPAPMPASPPSAAPSPGAFAASAASDKTDQGQFRADMGQRVVVETPLYHAVFSNQGGVLLEFSLKKYKRYLGDEDSIMLVNGGAVSKAPLALMLEGVDSALQGEWSFSGHDLSLGTQETGILEFKGRLNDLEIVRELIFSADSYVIHEKTSVLAAQQRNLMPAFTLAATQLAADSPPSIFSRLRYYVLGGEKPVLGESKLNLTRVAWLQNNSYNDESSAATLKEGQSIDGNVAWVGVSNNFFLCAVSMQADKGSSLFYKLDKDVYETSIGKSFLLAEPGTAQILEADYYIGPKVREMLANAPNGLNKALDYGWFTLIASPLVMLLQFFYSYVHNYGIAIILMTIVIKALFWPLSQKSYKSMEAMKRIQPEVAKIRERYAGDKESMNKEIMQMYRQHKINPASGCLPILVQIPVFIGLYQALLNSVELRHSAFIEYLPFTTLPWLNDLSAPDPYCITPLVMGLSMFIQQKMAPPAGDPMQAKIMLYLPLVFTFIFLDIPSGLVLYWLVNNIISIVQQRMQRKKSVA